MTRRDAIKILQDVLDDGDRECMQEGIKAALAILTAEELASYTTTSTSVEPMTRASLTRSLREIRERS